MTSAPDMRSHDLVIDFRIGLAYTARNAEEYQSAIEDRLARSADNALYATTFVDWFMTTQRFDKALDALGVFLASVYGEDGATLSRMSALALVQGDDEAATDYAERATKSEPDLKLAWWSLLRARAATDDFAGCIEALTALEENFGERFDAAKLRRDRAKAFHRLSASEEFKAWRESRR